jgi:hypothetical protein
MGVSYRAAIVVGLPTEEVEFDQEAAEEMELETFSPYYDAGWEDCLVGIPVAQTGEYSWKTIHPNDLRTDVERAEIKFKKATGLTARVFVTTYGW